jgi:hypothetical protein
VETYKHSVYLAASWSDDHEDLNSYVTYKLARQYGLLVVGDHKAYRDTPHERGLKYPERVNEILETCSGVVVVFPRKSYSQTTAPYIFLELLLALKHQLPVLLFCEEGVNIQWRKTREEIVLTFGDDAPDDASAAVSVETISEDTFQVASLRDAYRVVCHTSRFFNEPVFLPHSPSDSEELSTAISSLVEEYTNDFRNPERQGYAFNIMPFAKEKERLGVASAVFEETGFACINGSDTWSGAPFSREEIIEKISNAVFVISDLSGLSRACIFETGIAVGSGTE